MRPMVLLALLLTGCAGIPASPAALPSPEPVVLLIRVEARGGLCQAGTTCGSSITVMSDGTWTQVVNDTTRTGTLAATGVVALAAAVEGTELAVAPPFTGTCPIAYDGQEQVLSWLQDGAPVTVASCEREFDPTDTLVIATAALADELE